MYVYNHHLEHRYVSHFSLYKSNFVFIHKIGFSNYESMEIMINNKGKNIRKKREKNRSLRSLSPTKKMFKKRITNENKTDPT